jgi:hypothetical protein
LGLHAALDALLLGFVLISPWLLGFSDQLPATAWCIALVFIGMSLNVATDYPLGIIRKIPMSWHRLVELTTPVPFIAIPWWFFADAGAMPWATSAAGVGVVLNAALTHERKMPASEP